MILIKNPANLRTCSLRRPTTLVSLLSSRTDYFVWEKNISWLWYHPPSAIHTNPRLPEYKHLWVWYQHSLHWKYSSNHFVLTQICAPTSWHSRLGAQVSQPHLPQKCPRHLKYKPRHRTAKENTQMLMFGLALCVPCINYWRWALEIRHSGGGVKGQALNVAIF